MMPIITKKYFVPGELIYREDIYDDGNSNALYLIEEGEVELYYNCIDENNMEGISILKLHSG